jgi:hypothetical protein
MLEFGAYVCRGDPSVVYVFDCSSWKAAPGVTIGELNSDFLPMADGPEVMALLKSGPHVAFGLARARQVVFPRFLIASALCLTAAQTSGGQSSRSYRAARRGKEAA